MKVTAEVVKIECSIKEVKSGEVSKEIIKLFGGKEKEITQNILDQYLFEKTEAEACGLNVKQNNVLIEMIVNSNQDCDEVVKLNISED